MLYVATSVLHRPFQIVIEKSDAVIPTDMGLPRKSPRKNQEPKIKMKVATTTITTSSVGRG